MGQEGTIRRRGDEVPGGGEKEQITEDEVPQCDVAIIGVLHQGPRLIPRAEKY